MTVSSTISKVSYSGDDSTVSFPIPFNFTSNADIVAVLADADGNETTWTITTDYTLTGAGGTSGGTLTAFAAPATGETLVIYRDPEIKQLVDYVENDPFSADTHEGALDKLTYICQALDEKVGRALLQPVTSSGSNVTFAPPDAGKVLLWNATGTAVTNGPDADEIANAQSYAEAAAASAATVPTFAAFGETLAATTTASNARAALELGNAALLAAGVGANNLVQLNASGQLPAVDGSLLTGISSLPTGCVIAVASETVPTGYLECNGAAISRTTYATLYANIGIIHGQGDGSTTFNIPDYRGRFLRGWAHGSTLDPGRASRTAMATGGQTGDHVGSVQADEFKAHTHNVSANTVGSGYQEVYLYASAGQFKTTSSTGGNETRPTNANVMFCIKY